MLSRGRLKQRTSGVDILSTGAIGVDMDSLKDQAAIVGIGETVYNRESGRTELSMAVETAKKAIADAGPEPRDIDGMVHIPLDFVNKVYLATWLELRKLRQFPAVTILPEASLEQETRRCFPSSPKRRDSPFEPLQPLIRVSEPH